MEQHLTIVVSSPCVGACVLDAAMTYCLGCRRSMDEIKQWGGMAEAERLRIMGSLASRALITMRKDDDQVCA